jgi:hypothetical protein
VASAFSDREGWEDFGSYPTIEDGVFLEEIDEYERRRLTQTRYEKANMMLCFPIASSIYSFPSHTPAESMYAQVDAEGHSCMLMKSINDRKSD